MCGDSTSMADVENLMSGKKAVMIFTDPPYNLKISGLGSGSENSIGNIHGEFAMGSGEMSEQEFTEFLTKIFKSLIAVSTDGSIHYICMDWRHIIELTTAGLAYKELKNLCIWNKGNGGMGTFYRSKHELIFVYKNGKGKHINNFKLGETGRFRTNVWDYKAANSFSNPDREQELQLHPTVKPVLLVQDACLDCSRTGDIVLDLFGGSGSTLIACEKTGRNCYMMELAPNYVDVICQRWADFTGNDPVLEATGESFMAAKARRDELAVAG